MLLVLTATLIAITAQANDRKLGNVIAVERQITNIFDNCLNKVTSDTTKDSSFYVCSYSFLKSPTEIQFGKKKAMNFSSKDCAVSAEFINGFVFITFGVANGQSNFATAKNCLAKSINNNTPVDINIYSVE